RKGKVKQPAGRETGRGESVQDFIRREREEASNPAGFEDMDETFLRNVSRLGSRFKGTELGGKMASMAGEDEEEEVDMRMFQRPEERLTKAAAAERQRSRALAEHKRYATATSRLCPRCMDAPGFKKHLVLSLGEHTYLSLATGSQRLSEGHCYIVPLRHAPASTAFDEDVWREVDLFKSSLRRMAATMPDPGVAITDENRGTDATGSGDTERGRKERGKKKRQGDKSRGGDGGSVVFLETGSKPGSSMARHGYIEAVLVSREVALDAPIYFRQALLEAGDEWSTHKKVIQADPARGGVRRAVPKGFPYFHVEWDGGGYAHVIEGEEGKFPRDFGVETLAGILGIEPPSFGRKGRHRGKGTTSSSSGSAGDSDERAMVLSFLRRWRAFDWTAELDGETTGS
ncbi:unnamed protein product, partial [Discosporangium mesarthrocarpum]